MQACFQKSSPIPNVIISCLRVPAIRFKFVVEYKQSKKILIKISLNHLTPDGDQKKKIHEKIWNLKK